MIPPPAIRPSPPRWVPTTAPLGPPLTPAPARSATPASRSRPTTLATTLPATTTACALTAWPTLREPTRSSFPRSPSSPFRTTTSVLPSPPPRPPTLRKSPAPSAATTTPVSRPTARSPVMVKQLPSPQKVSLPTTPTPPTSAHGGRLARLRRRALVIPACKNPLLAPCRKCCRVGTRSGRP